VVGGALEESNVVTAEEFVRLIQAQRGFQANARIISIQNQLLEEAVNIV
jgi:flagellar hook protein FlgE